MDYILGRWKQLDRPNLGSLAPGPESEVVGRQMARVLYSFRFFSIASAAALLAGAMQVNAQTNTLSVPPESPQWDLEANAKVTDYQGRKCLMLDGGAAVLKDFVMRDAVMDVDVTTTRKRGFMGIQFRLDEDGKNGDWVYLRAHKSALPDAIQYTPIINGEATWQLYNGSGFTGMLDIPMERWFHLRLAVAGAQAKLYVEDMGQPALVIDDLKSGVQKGQLALFVSRGSTCFSNFEIHATPDVPWERHLPPTPGGTLTKWKLSPSYDALSRDLEQPLSRAEADSIAWQDVEAEPPGLVVINRYREAPGVLATFEKDFSTRLQPQPGMKVVYAITTIDSDRDQVRKLNVGYSDEVSVFLNGRILFRGRSAQAFRDSTFLGIVNVEDDAVYLPLKKGKNELILAVSEIGGGWGFICRLGDIHN